MTSNRAIAPADLDSRVLDFVQRELLGQEATVMVETDLLSGSLLDSMGVMRLVNWIREEFGLEIQPRDFLIENFRSVGAVAAYVRRSMTPPAV
jgi:acyl carrier protein